MRGARRQGGPGSGASSCRCAQPQALGTLYEPDQRQRGVALQQAQLAEGAEGEEGEPGRAVVPLHQRAQPAATRLVGLRGIHHRPHLSA